MKKAWSICIFLFVLVLSSFIRYNKVNDQFPVSDKFASPQNGDYITPLVFGIKNKDSILKTVPSSIYYQAMATNFSYVGNYKKALEYWALDDDSNKISLSERDDNLLKALTYKSAKKILIKETVNKKVVMFNEAHHMPLHRAFIITLLSDFKKEGFNYLALETLTHGKEEDALNIRKFVSLKSGIYTCEPTFAELVNLALQLGFKVVAYENTQSCNGGRECRTIREKGQAENLSKIISKDSMARIIVWAGYHHIFENNSFKMMAQYFKENTSIDPLTIDLVDMCERNSPVYENPFYTYIMSKNDFKEPMIACLNSNPIVLTEKKATVDLQVIFPRTSFDEVRPLWVNSLKTKKRFDLSFLKLKISTKQWVLIQSFSSKNKDMNSVPCDQIAINLNEENLTNQFLYLNKGEYTLKVSTLNHIVLVEQTIIIN